MLAEELSIVLGRSRGLTTSAVRLSDEKKVRFKVVSKVIAKISVSNRESISIICEYVPNIIPECFPNIVLVIVVCYCRVMITFRYQKK